jgi:hypothetical protein
MLRSAKVFRPTIGILRSLQPKLSRPSRAWMVFPAFIEPRTARHYVWPLTPPPHLPMPAAEGRSDELHHRTGGLPLTPHERSFVWLALALWEGPLTAKPVPITVMGFKDWQDFDTAVQQ